MAETTKQPQLESIGLRCCTSLFVKESGPIVYGIGSKHTGKVVYIGKTISPRKRFEAHRGGAKCNSRLSKWMNKHRESAFVLILQDGGNIDEGESRLIKAYRTQLFNVVDGSDEAILGHFQSSQSPLSAPRGVRCPSAMLIRWLTARKAKGVAEAKAFIRSLEMKDRMIYETRLAWEYEHNPFFGPSIRKWLSYTAKKLATALESNVAIS